jgi:hypothetical protein
VILALEARSATAQTKGTPTIPILRSSTGYGYIEGASLSVHGKSAYVWGYVRRKSFVDPPPWSRVEILVKDSLGKTIESTAARFSPNPISSGAHGQPPHSMFSAQLSRVPAPGTTILAIFDGNPER